MPGNRSPYNRPETVDETAEMIRSAGGSSIAIRVDHTVEKEVEEIFERVVRESGRLDILVNSIAGEDPLMAQWCSFWKTDLKNAEAALRQSLLSHIITAKHAAPYMIRNGKGLIVEVTENDVLSAGGNPITQVVKLALKGLALNMAAELRPHGVAAVAITPGFLRSESMLERFGVTEATWRVSVGRKIETFWNRKRHCLSDALWLRSREILRYWSGLDSFSVRGSWAASIDSRTLMEAGRIGVRSRSISPGIRRSWCNF